MYVLFLQTIASAAGHPDLEKVLEMIIHRAENGFDTNDHEFVHVHTGPRIWTEALGSFFGFKANVTPAEILHKAWKDRAVYKKARAAGNCVMSL